MKKNNIFTGILIGISMTILPLLLTSFEQKNDDQVGEVGSYQIFKLYTGPDKSDTVFETIIDTRTGEVVSRRGFRSCTYEKEYCN